MDYRKSIKTPLGALLVGSCIGLISWLPIEVSIGALLFIPVVLQLLKSKVQTLLFMAGYYLAAT